jgi:CRP/FNR family transcriptional regulator
MLDDRADDQRPGSSLDCAHQFDARCETCRLRALCLPAALGGDEIAALEAIIDYRRIVKANLHLYRAGQHFTAIYAIISGAVKTCRTYSDGKTCITGCYLPGELFGFSGINETSYSVNAMALMDTCVCEIPFDDLEAVCRRVPGLQNRFLHLMSHRIIDYQSHLGELRWANPAQNRLAAFLISLSSRAARRAESATDLRLPMTGQDIGNYLGISAEGVSRAFTGLVSSGAITKRGREIAITDMQQLKQLVCSIR